MITSLNGIKISAIAAAVSNRWVSLESLGKKKDIQMVQKFMKKTGVKGRYEAGLRQTTADFCFAAAKKILEEKKVSPDEIGVLVFVTQTPDYGIPATACVLQERLGISKDCIAFDVNLGCSGFSYGINIAASLLSSSDSGKALLLVGDTSAKERSRKSRTKKTHAASMLFGDSGTATLLEKDDEQGKNIHMCSKTDGSGFKAIIAPFGSWRNPNVPKGMGGVQMDDIAVFNFAVEEVPALLKSTMAVTGASPDDYDCLVLHQANLFILKQIAKRTGFEMEKVLVSIDEFANTSSSSIPISLVKEYGNSVEEREIRALMCGFGVGLSWSSVDAYLNTADILPLVHTDEYFDDGYSEEIKDMI